LSIHQDYQEFVSNLSGWHTAHFYTDKWCCSFLSRFWA